jgi:hypothetical protein
MVGLWSQIISPAKVFGNNSSFVPWRIVITRRYWRHFRQSNTNGGGVIWMVKVSTAFQTRRDGHSEVYTSGVKEER